MGTLGLFLVVFLSVCTGATSQDVQLFAALETAEARLALRDTVLEGDVGRLGGRRIAPVYQRLYNTTVAVTTRVRGDVMDIVFRIERPGTNRGAFTLTRSMRGGSPLLFTIQTRDDPGSYLVARASGRRSTVDVYHLDGAAPLYRAVIVPVAFVDLLVSPLERIVALTRSKIDWGFVLARGSGPDDRAVERLASDIRTRLGGLRDADDGAIDERGRYVHIATLEGQGGPGGLNCSGFVKWVVDGFFYPLTGRNTSVAEAKRTLDEERGTELADALYYMDPYFGLDWTRNLAALLDTARGHRPVGAASAQGHDVRSVERMVYTEDLGFPVADLRLLLYTLAVRDPGKLYLASINGVIQEDVALRQYFHTLVLLPYFDTGGRFRVAAFERVVETDLDSVLRRYDGHSIHLVGLSTHGVFDPLELP